MVFSSDREYSPYFPETKENWWHFLGDYDEMVQLALSQWTTTQPANCLPQASLLDGLPSAPTFETEEEYFEYAGAAVNPIEAAEQTALATAAELVAYGGGMVYLLSEGRHFTRVDPGHVVGSITTLCVLAIGQRVLVSDDLDYTYIVEDKRVIGDQVEVALRRARPVTDRRYVESLFEAGQND
jgi:hypothetical protein